MFMQIILALKKATKKLKRKMNFVTPTKYKKKKARFLEFGFKKANLNTLLRRVTL